MFLRRLCQGLGGKLGFALVGSKRQPSRRRIFTFGVAKWQNTEFNSGYSRLSSPSADLDPHGKNVALKGGYVGELGDNLQPVDLGTGQYAVQIIGGGPAARAFCALLGDNTLR